MPSYEFGWVASGLVTVEADNELQARDEALTAVKDQHSLAGISPDLEFLGKAEDE